MNRNRKQSKKITGMIAVLVALISLLAAIPVFAAAGNVYTCTVVRMYQHPVTGVIEDSGGESSYSIGQGMVEGCVYPTGILEVTDSGEYYLTIRMSLMDFTSGHSFQVQSWGDTGWSSAAQGITGTGSDENGTTADLCIQVPSENCVVRGTMYVEPMGRDVIWYMYPDNFTVGNSTDIAATMVTATSGSDTQTQAEAQPQTTAPAAQTQEIPTAAAPAAISTPASQEKDTTKEAETKAVEEKETTTPSAAALHVTEKETAAPAAGENENLMAESGLSQAQGLSLSTAQAAVPETGTQVVSDGRSENAGTQILVSTLSVAIPGLILIAAAVCAVYILRKNWHKWGHAPDDDEE